MENVVNQIVKKIKSQREKFGYTQKQLSKVSGVSYSTITKIESGKTKNPAFQQVLMICKSLNISIDELIKE